MLKGKGVGKMSFLIPSEEKIAKKKARYLFEKLDDSGKVECLLKYGDYADLYDFIEDQLDFLADDLLSPFESRTVRNVKRAWDGLFGWEQLDYLLNFFGYEGLEEFMMYNEDFLKEHFREEIEKIHWVRLMPYDFYPREDAVALVREMLADPQNEKLIKEIGIDKTIDPDDLDDNELLSIHYYLSGITY